MYIINKYGVLHSIPDEWALPAGARAATEKEIGDYTKADQAAKPARRQMKAEIAKRRAANRTKAEADEE